LNQAEYLRAPNLCGTKKSATVTFFQMSIVIVARWVSAFGFVASLDFGLVFAYLTIVTGRWLFGRKEL
jgi:hypothetical protein